MGGNRVLVVEDDPALGRAIKATLEADGYVVDATRSGAEAVRLLTEGDFAAATLDLLLPDKNGFLVSLEVRESGSEVPILVLTGKDGIWDEVEGLDSGADDFLTKPFEPAVLLARMRALCRRSLQRRPVDQLAVGDLRLDEATRSCSWRQQQIPLTPREYALLRVLVAGAGSPVSRTEILRSVWTEEHEDPHVVHVYIGYLRRKLEAAGASDVIRTVRGHGYALTDHGSGC